MNKLNGKWALVTGSSRGIGQQIAQGLARLDCNLVLHARDIDHLSATRKLLADSAVDICCVAGDIGMCAGRDAILSGIEARSVKVDILYNNAGIMSPWKKMWEITAEDWLQTFSVNLFGLVELTRALAPGMVERNFGRIINLSSGIKDTPQLTPYSVSKAAVDKYTADLAAQLRGTNVLANALDPGWLKTDLGGPDADYAVETVLPGALIPALLDENGPSGKVFSAQEYAGRAI